MSGLRRETLLPDFSRREVGTPELMDDPACDLRALSRTYAQFGTVNALVSGWRQVYLRELRPHMSPARPNTLLDVGCGGGDVPRQLARWAARDGLTLRVTAIDADERAIGYARAQPPLSGLHFRQAFSSDLVREGFRYDFLTSNHLLHHLQAPELAGLLRDSEALCTVKTVHSDIERSALAYAAFGAAITPFFRGSFIGPDGLLSIRRSYTASELRAAAPPGWTVRRQVPSRTLLLYAPQYDAGPNA
jgi:2-polyprenyl-3-methyl-5-hydroxy-6-metoxy-1,4-benzoquinol methylase